MYANFELTQAVYESETRTQHCTQNTTPERIALSFYS